MKHTSGHGAYKSGPGPSAQESPPPHTLAEQLDAAQNGAEFGAVIQSLFGTLEQQMEAEQ